MVKKIIPVALVAALAMTSTTASAGIFPHTLVAASIAGRIQTTTGWGIAASVVAAQSLKVGAITGIVAGATLIAGGVGSAIGLGIKETIDYTKRKKEEQEEEEWFDPDLSYLYKPSPTRPS